MYHSGELPLDSMKVISFRTDCFYLPSVVVVVVVGIGVVVLGTAENKQLNVCFAT